ncbi:GNAT family N-acetyltransferase [Guptibacillus hwajinpoensis]|uniref:GNAT family N-acetyltransferase n=1 Tax=Guptibacillus hwajinpoensis TaxID=208199 RepID=UPI003CFEAE28
MAAQISNKEVQLRDILEKDLPIFFDHQLDCSANYMAAFTSKDPTDRTAFMNRWANILSTQNIIKKTITYQEYVVGHIVKFEQFGHPEVSYWIGQQFWGNGIATNALRKFLEYVEIRPLYARAAKDNIGSIRVLEKCHFTVIDEDKGYSNSRSKDVEEIVLKLEKS